jgi:hypothetical protein
MTSTAQNLEVKNYSYSLSERYQNAAYAATVGATANLNSGNDVMVYKSADITDKLIATGSEKELSNAFDELVIRQGQEIPVCFFTSATGATYKLINGTQTKTIKDTTGSVLRWITPQAGSLTLKDNAESETLAEIINISLDSRCYHNALTLYFLNRYGGFDPYDFLSVDEEQEADKIKYHNREEQDEEPDIGTYTHRTWKRALLTGRPGARSQLQYLRDLVNATEVYDEDGNKVYVLSKVIRMYGDEVTPEITIEYKDDRCIKY